jgi:hypothetical protein
MDLVEPGAHIEAPPPDPALIRALPACPASCGDCSRCHLHAAGVSANALQFVRWLIAHRRLSDDDPAERTS